MTRFVHRLRTTAALVALAGTASAARIYYTDQPAGTAGKVVSLALDGSDQYVVTNVPGTPDLRGIAFHRASGRVFYLDNGAAAKRIYSMLTDGSAAQGITSVDSSLVGSDLEIDDTAGLLYWTENNPNTTGNGFIRRAGLDGNNAVALITTAPGTTTAPYFMFVDSVGGYIYWGVLSSGNGPSTFSRATLAGLRDVTFGIATATRTRDIAIDPRTGIAYWSDRQTGNIYKRALNGGANQVVIGNMNAPHGIALDLEAEKIYWADTGARGNPPSGLSPRRVARCNFDGTGFENLSTPDVNSEPWDLALDLTSTNYSACRTRFFSVTDTNAAPDFDADGDGAANLLEFALGTNSRRASDVPQLQSVGKAFSYKRRRGTDLVFRVEVKTMLGPGAWHYNGENPDDISPEWTVNSSIIVLDADYEVVTVASGSALSNASQVFFRLGVLFPETPAP
jgi:hypothetical protein